MKRENQSEHCISIHALLAESDRLWTILYSCPGNFYPRSPCGERQPAEHHASSQQEFLSTLSLRRATSEEKLMKTNTSISIHALLAESDREPTALRTPHQRFLSTLSLRRATVFNLFANPGSTISIHALLAESDEPPRFLLS